MGPVKSRGSLAMRAVSINSKGRDKQGIADLPGEVIGGVERGAEKKILNPLPNFGFIEFGVGVSHGASLQRRRRRFTFDYSRAGCCKHCFLS